MNDRKYVSHYDIFDYWKDKCITKDGRVEIEIGYEGHKDEKANINNSVVVITDWGEPECWACGRYIHNFDYSTNKSLKEIYNDSEVKSQLQKSHIIPHSLGGDESPDNMFLLCPVCHKNSPDTKFKKEFFRWIYKRKQRHGTDEQLAYIDAIEELAKRGIPPFITREDLSLKNMGTHGGMLVNSSRIAAITGACEERWERLKEFFATLGIEMYSDTIGESLTENISHKQLSFLSDLITISLEEKT